MASEGQIAFANGARTWTEQFDMVDLMMRALRDHGHSAVLLEKKEVEHRESGLIFRPLLVEFQPLDDGGVRTVTTVQTRHPALTAEGIFEFQHATGSTTEDSIYKGLVQWLQIDLPVFLDALLPKPANCMVMEVQLPASDGRPPRVRRVLLGPVSYLRQHEPPAESRPEGDQHDGFCQCCLFTNSAMSLKPLLEGNRLRGIRLFAMRGGDGLPAADCRVNGEDCPEGAAALRAYVGTWAQAGVEFRKQYVIIQTVRGGLAMPGATEGAQRQ